MECRRNVEVVSTFCRYYIDISHGACKIRNVGKGGLTVVHYSQYRDDCATVSTGKQSLDHWLRGESEKLARLLEWAGMLKRATQGRSAPFPCKHKGRNQRTRAEARTAATHNLTVLLDIQLPLLRHPFAEGSRRFSSFRGSSGGISHLRFHIF